MTSIGRWAFGALFGLGVLGLVAPGARSDDAEDWVNQQAQAQRDREQAEKDRQDRENWANQVAQAQKERDDWYAQQAQAQKEREQVEKDRQDRADWLAQQAQWQKDRADWLAQQAQAAKDREWAQKQRDLDEYLNQIWKAGEESQKWADEQARRRQDEINRGEWGPPAAAPPAPPPAGPVAAQRPPLPPRFMPPVPVPPPPPWVQPLPTHTVTIYTASRVTQVTYVMMPDGSWQAVGCPGHGGCGPAAFR
jgi:hypothetical protein